MRFMIFILFISLVNARELLKRPRKRIHRPPIRFIRSKSSLYNIDFGVNVKRIGGNLSRPLYTSIVKVQERLESIVIADLPGVYNYSTKLKCYNEEDLRPVKHILVDDLLVYINFNNVTGVAAGGPCYMNPIPRVGMVSFNWGLFNGWNTGSPDLETFEAILTHEVLHVMGIGTLWKKFLLPVNVTSPEFYNGTNGVAAFRGTLRGSGLPKVDTDFGGHGTHWDECTYGDEAMTPVLDLPAPVSVMTCGALSDLGYTVNTSACDTWKVPKVVPCINGFRSLRSVYSLYNDTL